MDALVVEEGALSILDSALIEDSWFDKFLVPDGSGRLRRAEVGKTVYILSEHADFDSKLFVLKLGRHGPLAQVPKIRVAWDRLVRVAMRHMDRTIHIPSGWFSYHEGSRLSIYAEPIGGRDNMRLVFEQSPFETPHIYAFGSEADSERPLSDLLVDRPTFRRALADYEEALVAETQETVPQSDVGSFGILLSEPLGIQLATQGSLQEWLDHKLNPQQSDFVEKPVDGPIRLRGAAGTGKTQAMAVKCLKEIYDDQSSGGDKTYAFITHSAQLAHEIIRGMFYAMDTSSKWERLRGHNNQMKLWVGTIYELAQETLDYRRKRIKPLDVDGRAGRLFQEILVNDAIDEIGRDARISLSLLSKCPEFKALLFSDDHRERIVQDILNEFACVLDAERVLPGQPSGEKYVSAPREYWQMDLPTPEHRQILLEIYTVYRKKLLAEGALSLDQMIADFDRHLQSHEWGLLKEQNGFDCIFVDEYHYMNRIETMTLQHLFRSCANNSGRWPLIMAYDLKQSMDDRALGGGIDKFQNPGVGASSPIDLVQNYRSTPEISDFLSDIDGAYPAMDLEGEFVPYVAKASKANGKLPALMEFDSNTSLIDGVLDFAVKEAAKSKNGGRDVAVLCLNEGLFDVYQNAGRTHGKIVPLTSRADLKELKYAKRKCIFSMPRFVAGLQFETVILIHADEADLTGEYLSHGHRRRVVTNIYLGASRCTDRLYLASSKERGGFSQVLRAPISNGTLTEVETLS